MSKKLEGNGLYESSRMIIPQHRQAYLQHQFEIAKQDKPIIDEQEWQLIGQVLYESFEKDLMVNITVFDPFKTRELKGYVTVINSYLKEIKFSVDEDDYERIKFSEIIRAIM